MKKHIRPCSRRHPYIYIRVPDGYCIENHSFKHKRQSNQQMGCCPLCGLIRKDKTMAKGKQLTLKDVEKVEELLQAGMTVDAIARILEIAPISINRIKNGEHILQIRGNKEADGQLHNELLSIYRVLNEIKDGIDAITKELGAKQND